MAVLCFCQKFKFAQPPWGPEGGAERLITGTENLPSRTNGSGAGNKSRAGKLAAEDAIQ